MKIKKEDYEMMKRAIAPLKDKIAIHREYLKTDSRVKDLEKRLRWDCLFATRMSLNGLYQYLNDDHIDTALKAIIKDLEG